MGNSNVHSANNAGRQSTLEDFLIDCLPTLKAKNKEIQDGIAEILFRRDEILRGLNRA